MSIKTLKSIKPTRFKKDAKGNLIPVYRAGIRDTNKYARKTPSERRHAANMGNADYNPDKPDE